jgi:hypothetical protein
VNIYRAGYSVKAAAAGLATAIRMVATHITPEHRDAARAALKRGIGNADPHDRESVD